MAINASSSARLAPTRLRGRVYLTLAALLTALMLAFTFSGGSRAQLKGRVTVYCALAFPPSQVARWPQLEAVYCRGLDAGKQCQADVGWIVASEPVLCD